MLFDGIWEFLNDILQKLFFVFSFTVLHDISFDQILRAYGAFNLNKVTFHVYMVFVFIVIQVHL